MSWREGYGLKVRFDDTGEESERLDVDELLQWRRITYIPNAVALADPPEPEVRFEFNPEIQLAPIPPDPLSTLTIGTVITVGNASFQLFRVTYEDGLVVYHVNDAVGNHRTFGANVMRAMLMARNPEAARQLAEAQPIVATHMLQGWCEP